MNIRCFVGILTMVFAIYGSFAACNTCDTGTCGGPLHIVVFDGIIPTGGSLDVSSGGNLWECSENLSTDNCNRSLGKDFTEYQIDARPEDVRIRVLDRDGVVLRDFEVKPQYTTSAEPLCQPSCRNFAEIIIEN